MDTRSAHDKHALHRTYAPGAVPAGDTTLFGRMRSTQPMACNGAATIRLVQLAQRAN
jgi:hypothetical protein